MRDEELGKLLRDAVGPEPDTAAAWGDVSVAQREAMLAGIEAAAPDGLPAGLRPPERGLADRLRSWLGGWRGPALGLAVATAAVALVVLPGTPPADGDRVRAKGAVHLRVWRARGERVDRVWSGQRFRPGDRLRFAVDLPTDGHLLLVGIEAGGTPSAAHPLGAAASIPAAAGEALELPGAVALDAAPGDEWLHLVHCDEPFGLADLEPEARGAQLRLPGGCRAVRFHLAKGDE